MVRITVRSVVLGLVKARGPVTFNEIKQEVLTQVPGVSCLYKAGLASVQAINELMKQGDIELYETGDAWW